MNNRPTNTTMTKEASSVSETENRKKADEDWEEDDDNDKMMFHNLDEPIQHWILELGLQTAYGQGERAYDLIVPNRFSPPSTCELMFQLADYLFPGNAYHQRLFDIRNRCGIDVWKVLIQLKITHGGHKLFFWHEGGQQWLPPNKEVLIYTITVIREEGEKLKGTTLAKRCGAA